VVSAGLTVVVGAGISGLACAHALGKAGRDVVVLDDAARPGGVIESQAEAGYLLELGPQSFTGTPALLRLIEELGLTGQLVEAPPRAPRYVLTGKVLIPVPMSPGAFLASRLLGRKTKLAILTEVLRTSHPPEPDESVAAFTRRKFSDELLDRLVGPFLSGIFAGDPEQTSLRAAFPKLYEAEKRSGSVVRGLFRSSGPANRSRGSRPGPRLLSFRDGNETLVRALAGALGSRLLCGTAVTGLDHGNTGFVLQLRKASGPDRLACERVVLATPASAAAQILSTAAPAAAAALGEIEYAPVAVVSLGYPRRQIGHSLEGFGFLVPRSSGLRTLGTVWNSSLFPLRAPRDHVLLTSFVGGATDPGAVERAPGELAGRVHEEIRPVLGIGGDPAMLRVTFHRRAIPQYTLGHAERLRAVREGVAGVAGLSIAGAYGESPAIGACVERALAVAEQTTIGYNT
jgi:protoporphyrinogen/coproporphyrinogen III oxidase